jgi:hypothetical protein
MHAAIIAREIRLSRVKRGVRVALDPFMLVPEAKRNQQSRGQLVNALKAMAGGQRKHISEVKKRPVRKKVNRGESRVADTAARPASTARRVRRPTPRR